MTFESMHEPAHLQRFPGLALAWESLQAPSGTTAVLNAANEVAVELFLKRSIRFDQINAVNLETLATCAPPKPQSLEDLLEIDLLARSQAREVAAKLLQKHG